MPRKSIRNSHFAIHSALTAFKHGTPRLDLPCAICRDFSIRPQTSCGLKHTRRFAANEGLEKRASLRITKQRDGGRRLSSATAVGDGCRFWRSHRQRLACKALASVFYTIA